MKITCISDLHGTFPKTSGGDLLLLAGDYTTNDSIPQWKLFYEWLDRQDYKAKVYIAGNHDNFLSSCSSYPEFEGLGIYEENMAIYLCDNSYTFQGLKIYGLPYTKWFHGVNPKCKAFMLTERELAKKYANIPQDTDILLTHNPPYAILDDFYEWGDKDKQIFVGSPSLREKIEAINPKLVVCGHIHEHGGKQVILKGQSGKPDTLCLNASLLDREYEYTNKPIDVLL